MEPTAAAPSVKLGSNPPTSNLKKVIVTCIRTDGFGAFYTPGHLFGIGQSIELEVVDEYEDPRDADGAPLKNRIGQRTLLQLKQNQKYIDVRFISPLLAQTPTTMKGR